MATVRERKKNWREFSAPSRSTTNSDPIHSQSNSDNVGHPSRRTSSQVHTAGLPRWPRFFQFSRSVRSAVLACEPDPGRPPTPSSQSRQSVRPSPPTRAPTLPPAIAQHSSLVLTRIGTTHPLPASSGNHGCRKQSPSGAPRHWYVHSKHTNDDRSS